MTDCVHAAMNDLEPSAFKAVTNRPPAHAEVNELGTSNQTVLALRDGGYHPVHVDLCPYDGP